MIQDLNRLIQNKKLKFFFKAESVADLNAIKGFIRALRVQRKHILISYGSEITRRIAHRNFKGYHLKNNHKRSADLFPIRFDTEGSPRLSGHGITLNYDPYKYCFLEQASLRTGKAHARKMMGIKKNRKIIIVSCSSRSEVYSVLEECQKLDLVENPLLIFGLRRPDLSLAANLRRKGFRVHDRRQTKSPLSYFDKSDAVILNTTGEFFELMKAADLAIVGHDRNIFEPALLGIPILYFAQPINMRKNEEGLAKLFKLFWRKNRTVKILLEKCGGAIQIKRAFFARQITNALHDPAPMVSGICRAVWIFHRRIVPAANLRTASIVATGITGFKPAGESSG